MTEQNAKGATTAFSTFTPFRSWWARLAHWFVLKAAPAATDEIRRQRGLHHMSLLSVSPGALKRAQIAGAQRLKAGAMLFISAFNGKAEPHVRGFSEHLARDVNQIWRGCVDWKGTEPYTNLEQFIESYQRRVDCQFSAYTLTSSSSRTALRVRAELDELIALAHGDPAQFLVGYRRAAQLASDHSAES